MTKSRISMLNAVSSLLQILVLCIVGLLLSKTILTCFGSDYNGINSAAVQIVNALLIFEGGFTLASNVALFSPFAKKDYNKINGILAATRKRFIAVGCIVFSLGILLALIYPFIVTSSMPKTLIFLLMLTVIVPTSINLGMVMKYRVLILTTQKEYLLSLTSMSVYLLGNGIAILLMQNGYSILVARIAIMLFLLAGYAYIIIYCRKNFPFVNFNVKPMFSEIKGTLHVIMLKIVSVCYSAMPIVVISTLPEDGVLLASVYAIYKSTASVPSSSLRALCNAPRLGFGILFAENNLNLVKELFRKYEIMICIMLSVILGTTCLLFLPFITLFTKGIVDVDYRNISLAIIFLTTVFIEIIHIPSGQMIQMKGEFGVSQKIQTGAFIVLLLSMFAGRLFFGIIGIALAVFFAACVLAIFEVYYTMKYILHRRMSDFFKNIMPCLIILSATVYIGLGNYIVCDSYWSFCAMGLVFVAMLSVISIAAYYCIGKKEIIGIYRILNCAILSRYRRKKAN